MLRHTINHLGVVAASKVMPLASLLIYSRFLEPAEYGVISLFFSYIWVFGILLTLNMHTAIGRFIYDKTINSGELIGTTLLSISVLFSFGIVLVLANHSSVAVILNLPPALLPLLFIVTAGQVAESLLVQILTARERSGHLLAIVLIRSLCALFVTIALLYTIRTDRYFAVLYAEAIFSLLLTAYLLSFLAKNRPWSVSKTTLQAFANYSIPLIPYMLSQTLLSQLDRIMIDRMFDKEATGLYSVGYNLGMMLVMVAGALINALNPRFFAAMDGKRYGDVRRDAYSVFMICMVCAFLIALYGPAVASIFIPQKYESGYNLIPLFALGGLVSVIFQVWGRVIGYAKKTYLLSVVAIVATVTKILLNFVLLPEFGFLGGAVTTVIAYGFMATAVVVIINRDSTLPEVYISREMLWIGALATVIAIEQFNPLASEAHLLFKLFVLLVVAIIFLNNIMQIMKLSKTQRLNS
jgi:O-antigen/teichoic acid export membrane protein